MPGLGAIGAFAIGTVPSSTAITYTLSAASGSFALTGEATAFTLSEADHAGSFALTGTASLFSLSQAPAAGSFTLTGEATAFAFAEAVASGAFALTGIATTDTDSEAAATGSFALTGIAATMAITYGSVPAGSFALSGVAQTFNFEVPEGSGIYVLDGISTFSDREIIGTVLYQQMPINCVLIGEQLYDKSGRTFERGRRRNSRRTAVSAGQRGRLSGDAPSFSVTQSARGYD